MDPNIEIRSSNDTNQASAPVTPESIAVIAAAIAASAERSTYKLNIRSIRRIPSYRPAWSAAGLNDTMGKRL